MFSSYKIFRSCFELRGFNRFQKHKYERRHEMSVREMNQLK